MRGRTGYETPIGRDNLASISLQNRQRPSPKTQTRNLQPLLHRVLHVTNQAGFVTRFPEKDAEFSALRPAIGPDGPQITVPGFPGPPLARLWAAVNQRFIVRLREGQTVCVGLDHVCPALVTEPTDSSQQAPIRSRSPRRQVSEGPRARPWPVPAGCSGLWPGRSWGCRAEGLWRGPERTS